MKRKAWQNQSLVIVVLFILLGVFFQTSVKAEQGMLLGAAGQEGVGPTDGSGELNTSYIFALPGGYVAAGDGIRGVGSGSITISGIPTGASIVQALLYWQVLSPTPPSNAGVFDGYPISGTTIGTDVDPCWGLSMITSFRADVTAYVPGNGTYSLSDFPDSGDPSVAPSTEGASLVVVYEHSASPQRTIIINDGCATLFPVPTVTTTFTGFTASESPEAQITYIVGDGQPQYYEETVFNSTTIAVDNFEGSDGEMWDTDTFDVSSLVSEGDTSAEAAIAMETDCLTWGAAVFSVSSEPAGVVTGRVTCCETGAPLRAFVLVIQNRTPFWTLTDADGYYEITGLEPGRCLLLGIKRGYGHYIAVVEVPCTHDFCLEPE